MADAMNFSAVETPENFMSADTDRGQWTPEDHTDDGVAKSFLGHIGASYSNEDLQKIGAMLATPIDEDGHGLGDSRLFIRAAARAARQFDEVLRQHAGGQDNYPRLKFNMPPSPEVRRTLQREAQAILEREFMAARAEYIKRSGRPLPGWWK